MFLSKLSLAIVFMLLSLVSAIMQLFLIVFYCLLNLFSCVVYINIKIKNLVKFLFTFFSDFRFFLANYFKYSYLVDSRICYYLPLFITPVGGFAVKFILLTVSFFLPVVVFEFIYFIKKYYQKEFTINQFLYGEDLQFYNESFDTINARVNNDVLEKIIVEKKLERETIVDKQYIFGGSFKSFNFKFYVQKERELTFLINKLELIVKERKHMENSLIKWVATDFSYPLSTFSQDNLTNEMSAVNFYETVQFSWDIFLQGFKFLFTYGFPYIVYSYIVPFIKLIFRPFISKFSTLGDFFIFYPFKYLYWEFRWSVYCRILFGCQALYQELTKGEFSYKFPRALAEPFVFIFRLYDFYWQLQTSYSATPSYIFISSQIYWTLRQFRRWLWEPLKEFVRLWRLFWGARDATYILLNFKTGALRKLNFNEFSPHWYTMNCERPMYRFQLREYYSKIFHRLYHKPPTKLWRRFIFFRWVFNYDPELRARFRSRFRPWMRHWALPPRSYLPRIKKGWTQRPFRKTWHLRRMHNSSEQVFNKVFWGADDSPYLFKPIYTDWFIFGHKLFRPDMQLRFSNWDMHDDLFVTLFYVYQFFTGGTLVWGFSQCSGYMAVLFSSILCIFLFFIWLYFRLYLEVTYDTPFPFWIKRFETRFDRLCIFLWRWIYVPLYIPFLLLTIYTFNLSFLLTSFLLFISLSIFLFLYWWWMEITRWGRHPFLLPWNLFYTPVSLVAADTNRGMVAGLSREKAYNDAIKNKLCRDIGIKVWSDVDIVSLGSLWDETITYEQSSFKRLAFEQESFWFGIHSISFHKHNPFWMESENWVTYMLGGFFYGRNYRLEKIAPFVRSITNPIWFFLNGMNFFWLLFCSLCLFDCIWNLDMFGFSKYLFIMVLPYQLLWRVFWYQCESVSPTGDPRLDDDDPTQHLEPLYFDNGYKNVAPISNWLWLGGPKVLGTWDAISEEYPGLSKRSSSKNT